MDSDTLQQIMDRFLRKNFGVEDAEGIFGPVVSDRNPSSLILKPRSQSVDRAHLGMIDRDGERALSYIYLKLNKPFPVDLGELTDAYGSPEEGVRLKPDEPVPYFFDVKGRDFVGNLMLGLEPGKGDSRQFTTVRFTRTGPRAD